MTMPLVRMMREASTIENIVNINIHLGYMPKLWWIEIWTVWITCREADLSFIIYGFCSKTFSRLQNSKDHWWLKTLIHTINVHTPIPACTFAMSTLQPLAGAAIRLHFGQALQQLEANLAALKNCLNLSGQQFDRKISCYSLITVEKEMEVNSVILLQQLLSSKTNWKVGQSQSVQKYAQNHTCVKGVIMEMIVDDQFTLDALDSALSSN